MITIRASSTPRLLKCRQSYNVDPDTPVIDQSIDAGRVGSAAHKWLAHYLMTDQHLSYDDLAAEFNANADEIKMLVSRGLSIWQDIGSQFGQYGTEIELKAIVRDEPPKRRNRRASQQPDNPYPVHGITLTGTADLFGYHEVMSGKQFWGFDWKATYKEEDIYHLIQLKSYAFLALYNNPDLMSFVIGIGYLRSGNYIMHSFSSDDMSQFRLELMEALEPNPDAPYHIGEWCDYCPRRFEPCPAIKQANSSTVERLTGKKIDLSMIIERGEFHDFLIQIRQIERLCTEFKAQSNAHLEAGGKIICGDIEYFLRENTRRSFDIRLAFPVLKDKLGKYLADALTISKASIETAAGLLATEVGKKIKAKTTREIMAELDEKQAIHVTHYNTMEKREVKKEDGEPSGQQECSVASAAGEQCDTASPDKSKKEHRQTDSTDESRPKRRTRRSSLQPTEKT